MRGRRATRGVANARASMLGKGGLIGACRDCRLAGRVCVVGDRLWRRWRGLQAFADDPPCHGGANAPPSSAAPRACLGQYICSSVSLCERCRASLRATLCWRSRRSQLRSSGASFRALPRASLLAKRSPWRLQLTPACSRHGTPAWRRCCLPSAAVSLPAQLPARHRCMLVARVACWSAPAKSPVWARSS